MPESEFNSSGFSGCNPQNRNHKQCLTNQTLSEIKVPRKVRKAIQIDFFSEKAFLCTLGVFARDKKTQD
ncbi:MAG: hypothetical protein BWK80_13765 [Desulfobacteraceae bacterium IS3]|nr:MAG: hypothetical protein BWK80_13765 [Desulfobacteraceae bacterium IS3]